MKYMNEDYIAKDGDPKIPSGYEYAGGSAADDFTIRHRWDNSEFVWIPDETNPNGGFYLAKYPASRASGNIPQFVEGKQPWTMLSKKEARRLAADYIKTRAVRSRLPKDSDIEAVVNYLKAKGRLTDEDIKAAETMRHNVWASRGKALTGSHSESFDLFKNIDEWTVDAIDEPLSRCGVCRFPSTSHCYHRAYSCYEFWGFRVVLQFDDDTVWNG